LLSIPDGAAGTRQVLKHMRELVRADKRRPALRHFAQQLVKEVRPKDWQGEIAAVFNFVRTRIRYSLDVNNIEVIQSAPKTLQLGYGDCDDKCVCAASLLESLGHVCFFCALGFDQIGEFSHVIVLVSAAGESELQALDTTEPYPLGWFPPGATCAMIAEI
jgi:hypothetical protein